MTSLVPQVEIDVETPLPRVTYVQKMAKTIRDNALEQARARVATPHRDVDLEDLLRSRDFLERFKYGLSSGVANALAANDQRVLAIYTYDFTINADSDAVEDIPLETTVDLLVLVTTPSAALETLCTSLDQALTASLKRLPTPRFTQCNSVLNVSLITEEDVRHGAGYARMLSGIVAPPIKIWQRDS